MQLPNKLYDILKWFTLAGIPWFVTILQGINAIQLENHLPPIPYIGVITGYMAFTGAAISSFLAICNGNYYKNVVAGMKKEIEEKNERQLNRIE